MSPVDAPVHSQLSIHACAARAMPSEATEKYAARSRISGRATTKAMAPAITPANERVTPSGRSAWTMSIPVAYAPAPTNID